MSRKKKDKHAWHKRVRRENEEKIICALSSGPKTVGQIKKEAGLSRTTIYDVLKALREKGIVKKDGELWVLGDSIPLEYDYAQRVVFSCLSTHIFHQLYDRAGKISDEEFLESFIKKIGLVAVVALLVGLDIGREHPEEGGRWIEEGIGTLIQVYAWRVCLLRQLLGGPYKLRGVIDLKEPVKADITKEKLLIIPAALEKGLTGAILKVLPEIPENRLRKIWRVLRNISRGDVDKLRHGLRVVKEVISSEG